MPKMKAPPNPARELMEPHLPEWLLDMLAPEGIDPTDLATTTMGPAGMVVKGTMRPALKRLLGFLEESYPRIAKNIGTVEETTIPKPSLFSRGVLGRTARRPITEMPDRTNNPVALRKWLKQTDITIDPDQSDLDAADTLIHEYTHSGGAARDSNYFEKIAQQEKHVPYELLPSELKGNRVPKALMPGINEAIRLGTTPKQMKIGKGQAKAHMRKPIPGSMAEFQPMPAHDVNPLDPLLPATPVRPQANPEADAVWEAFMKKVRARTPK